MGKSPVHTHSHGRECDYPPAAQDFFKRFKQKFGKDPEHYAIYGYEAMKVALLAIQNAGDEGNDR
jgi:branched-chain amino acid transport system substrate-binding protein